MKKFKLKFIKMAAVFIVAAGIWNLSGFIHAASLSVTASASTIYVGDSVTFTVSASGGAGNVSVSGRLMEAILAGKAARSPSR